MRDVIRHIINEHNRGAIQGDLAAAIEDGLVRAGYGKRKIDWEIKDKKEQDGV